MNEIKAIYIYFEPVEIILELEKEQNEQKNYL
jgi:hypothetical protein